MRRLPFGTRLDGHLVISQIERHDEGPGAVRRRQGSVSHPRAVKRRAAC